MQILSVLFQFTKVYTAIQRIMLIPIHKYIIGIINWQKGHTVTGTAGARSGAIWRQNGASWRHLEKSDGTDRHLAPDGANHRQKMAPAGAIWRHLLALLAPDGFSFLVPTAIWRHPKNPSDLAPSVAIWRQIWLAPHGDCAKWR